MNKSFSTIGLIGKQTGSHEVAKSLAYIASFLADKKLNLVIDQNTASLFPSHQYQIASREKLGQQCDLAIVIGGDGTLLHAARSLVDFHTPLLGIKLGRLGFLADVLLDSLEKDLTQILQGEYLEESRFLLQAELSIHNQPYSLIGTALNDVVVHTTAVCMIEFETYINKVFLNSQRADGLIIATPTGSTAYALSAGGPILDTNLNGMVLVSICSHALSDRPLVFHGDGIIEIKINTPFIASQISCDGQSSIKIHGGDQLRISKYPKTVRLIHPVTHNHYDILRTKLHWGKNFG
ncbi:NAD(+) kinase [Candidatus Nitrosacidococcus sp. I8]|uniref:NAD(+) kinase n=1 Tax=Candidatus Nitrosacidococcus sp. I8 TaxID=2942908 RepID=UPI00222750BC|nr:NAD(+) kinase [Candidatus Nitrosacidococcus sp. I8]CAH9018943.1 NAD kinase [Candidatus Nitrosacidococcus sp. I8]